MKIGIIGGGQLGYMLAQAAHKIGHTVIGLDPLEACPLSHIAEKMFVSSYGDTETFHKFAKSVDVITYEFENVDPGLVDEYIEKIPQKSLALKISSNRFYEKEFAQKYLIPTAKYVKYESKKSLFFPAIVKTTMGGYDGKGQFLIMNVNDVNNFIPLKNSELIVEEYLDFDFEISVVATRGISGEIEYFPIPINIHRNGILFTSSVYDSIPVNIQTKAYEYTKRILELLQYVGTLTVEFFVIGSNVVFNEFAPRPHNSGHYTIEGCNVSQFENHIRAITGDTLVKPLLLKPSIMINVLGQDTNYVYRMNSDICVYHNYKKDSPRHNRKMAHITCTSFDKKLLKDTIKYIIGDFDE